MVYPIYKLRLCQMRKEVVWCACMRTGDVNVILLQCEAGLPRLLWRARRLRYLTLARFLSLSQTFSEQVAGNHPKFSLQLVVFLS